jgi:type IV pilus assembly protein PilX
MNRLPRNQQGAVLIVALVMLLIITLLAVSSTRESALESRMTANFVAQQQQLNYAESALREGEEQMTFAALCARAPNSGGTCDAGDEFCLYTDAAKYAHDFGSCDTASSQGIASTLLDTSITEPELRWYSIPAPTAAAEGASENPEYGNWMMGIGTFRYEVSGWARNDSSDTCTVLRSATSKVFNIPRAQCQ